MGFFYPNFVHFLPFLGWTITFNHILFLINTSNEPSWHALPENGRQPQFWPRFGVVMGFFYPNFVHFLPFLGWTITFNHILVLINTSNEPSWHALSENGRQPQFWPQFGVDMGGFYANFREFSPFLVLPVYKNLLLHPALGSDPTLKYWKRTFPLHFGCNLDPMDTGWASSMGITLTGSEQKQKLVSFMSRLI